MPIPKLPGMVSPNNSFVPTLSFWVTSFGKIHRPGCSFYQRGGVFYPQSLKGLIVEFAVDAIQNNQHRSFF